MIAEKEFGAVNALAMKRGWEVSEFCPTPENRLHLWTFKKTDNSVSVELIVAANTHEKLVRELHEAALCYEPVAESMKHVDSNGQGLDGLPDIELQIAYRKKIVNDALDFCHVLEAVLVEGKPEPRRYYVSIAVDGRYNTTVSASSFEEAKERAFDNFETEDGDVISEIVDVELVHTEDEFGNTHDTD